MAYSFTRTVTVDHTKCGASSSTDFPMLFYGTYSYLKTVGNGGNVTSSNGYDIVFTSDSGGTSLLDFELVTYDASTGAVEFWIRIPTLSHSADTVIYLFYGNAAITTYQGNTNGTWESSFKCCYHFKDSAGSPVLTDSTSNARNGSVTAATVSSVAGKIGNAHKVDNSGYTTYADTGLPAGATSRTISFWTTYNGSFANYLMGYGTQSNDQAQGMYVVNNVGVSGLYVGWNDDVTTTFSPSLASSNTTFYHFVYTYNSADNKATFYENGQQITQVTKASWNTVLPGSSLTIGIFYTPSGASASYIDEVRISSSLRNADWILAEYNNQNDPATFYTVGSPAPIGGGGVQMNLDRQIGNLNTVRIH